MSAYLLPEDKPWRRRQDVARGKLPANLLPVLTCEEARLKAFWAWMDFKSVEPSAKGGRDAR